MRWARFLEHSAGWTGRPHRSYKTLSWASSTFSLRSYKTLTGIRAVNPLFRKLVLYQLYHLAVKTITVVRKYCQLDIASANRAVTCLTSYAGDIYSDYISLEISATCHSPATRFSPTAVCIWIVLAWVRTYEHDSFAVGVLKAVFYTFHFSVKGNESQACSSRVVSTSVSATSI